MSRRWHLYGSARPQRRPHGRDRTFDFCVGFARHRDRFQHIPQSVKVTHCSLSGGSLHSSAAPDLHHDRVDVAPDHHVARATRRHARQMRQHGASDLVDQFIDRVTPHQGALLLLDPDAQQSRLRLGMLRISLSARRLLPLAPQVSQVGNAALVEREAVTLPLDHAFGFELADVGPAAIEVQRQCRRADGRGLSGSRSRDRLGDGRAINGTVSAIVFVPIASR